MSKIVTNVTNLNAVPTNLSAKVSKTGDTMSGALVVQNSISASTASDANFNLGGNRTVMDLVPATRTARLGGINGGGSATKLELYANNMPVVLSDVNGFITTPYQPYALWNLWLTGWTGSYYTRSVSIVKNVGNAAASVAHPMSGSYARFTAPVSGRYLITVNAHGISQTPGFGPNGYSAMTLICMYTSNGYYVEFIDTRNAHLDEASGALVLYLNAGDYVNPDWYTGSVGYESGGSVEVTVSLIG